ncbi:MAG: tetratricopeptide repeat protein [Saprospiraceae bacterium]
MSILVYLFWGGIYSLDGQDSSLSNLLQKLPLETNDSTRALMLAEIGDLYYEENFDSTIYYYYKAIDLCQKIPYYSIEYSSWRSLGYVYSHRKNDFDSSLLFFQKALDLGIAKNDSIAMAYALSDMGRIYWKQGKPFEALEYHLQVKEIGERIQSPKVILRANTSLGILENENGNNTKAKAYYKEALLLADTLRKDRSKGILFNNLGKACQDDGSYELALNYFLQADSIFMKLKDSGWLSLISYNKGRNFVLQGDIDKGIEYYESALHLNKNIENKEREVMIRSGLAVAYLKLKQAKPAISYAEKALLLLKEVDTNLYYDEIYQTLAESYELKGDNLNAFRFYKKLLRFKKEVDELEVNKKIASLNHLFDLKKRENRILQLKTVNLEKDRNLKIYKSNLRAMVFAFFALFAFALLAFYLNKMKEFRKIDIIKNNLANDLHDDIGASLNRIKMLSSRIVKTNVNNEEKADILEKIKMTSNGLIYDMHDIVWSLDKRNETIANLLERVQDHADVFLGDFGIPYKFDIDISNQNKILDTKRKINTYLIFKESINNILKHTEAEKILISFSEERTKYFKMTISSFYTSKKETGKSSKGQGLNNMKKRAKALKGELHIVDNPGNYIVKFSF